MQIGSVVWEEFLHTHTYIHTEFALSMWLTLNTKPASQVLITATTTATTINSVVLSDAVFRIYSKLGHTS